MYTLKGFFTYSSLTNNTRDQVAQFGELSSDGNTYAKDKLYYTDDAAPLTTLIAFHSVKDGIPQEVPFEMVPRVLTLGHYLFDRAIDGLITDSPEALSQSILAEFSGQLTDFTMGQLLTDGSVYLPEWISFKDALLGEDNHVTLWLSDDSFRRQYNEYIIEVVPPFVPLDDFFKDPIQVKGKLDQYSIVTKIQEVQAARGPYPYSLLLAHEYDYRDPQNHSYTLPTYWVVIIYGQAGNNPDVIKNALIDYILANSTHTRAEWTEILPDLFITTEFIITPFWNQYSVPNRQLQAGIYSPVLNPRELLPLLKQTTKGPMYTSAWIDGNYELTTNIYKSLAFGIVGNPQNRDGLVTFSEVFADYMLVTNESPDFNRIEPYTQEWMVLLSQMITLAEEFTATSSVPLGFARVEREGVLYVAATYDNITYLVVAKSALEAIAPAA